ncbi:MAG: histidine kinase, partial [Clostridiales bacterium]|nr:histidine kinase [Clostridiales bacterium]
MNVAKPIKRAGFREGIRNTFLRYALYPILALVALWGGAVLMYSFFAAQGANRIVNEQMMNVLAKQYTAYETMLLEAEREPELMASLVENASLAQITRANEILYAFNNRQTIRSIFYLFNSKGELISSNTWEEREGFTIEKRFSPYVIEQIRQKRKRQIYQLTVRRQTPGERNTVFTMSASLWRGTEIAGYLVFDLQENDFTQFTSSTDVNYTVITDRYHNALATNDTGILGAVSKFSPLVQGDGHVNLGGNHMYLTIGLREGCPFQVFTLTSLALLNQIFLFGLLFIPATSLLLILLMTRLARRVVEKNATHLDELIQSVEAMRQGNYQYQFTSGNEHTDEFAYLSEQYQFLFRRIGRLVEVNRELANARRLTEIRQLEAQFNPHFIFNVLETIKYEMLINKESAAEIINLLAKLLRYCISREGDTVTLRHDLEYIKTYLALQKVRYDENLTYEIFIP